MSTADSVERHTVVIVGSGFGAQAAAAYLRRSGIHDFVMLERRDVAGGTWVQNSYPGAAVDVQSPLYSLSFEPYDWSQMFAEQSELATYTEHVLTKYDLHDKIVLGAEVTRIEWDGAGWVVSTEASGTFHGRFLINASGPLSTPSVPPFPGRHTFRGPAFHTNEWDHTVDLRGKRVAIVGSGSSAAQVIPAIAADVAQLHVFQRTPHWVMSRHDHDFSPLQRRLLRIPAVYQAVRSAIYWGLETRVIGFKYSRLALRIFAQNKAMKLMRKQISDPELRRKLTPDYTIGCKRVILSNTLYPALSAPNVMLHDRDDGIAHIDADGITTTTGAQVKLDVIVWATGFDATDGLIPYPIIGRGGEKLSDFWSDFPRAYLGTTIPGFPNLFLVTGPNTGIGHTSGLFVIESQLEYISRAINAAQSAPVGTVEVRSAVEADYTAMIHREMKQTVWQSGGCHSWYQSRDGHVVAMYPGFTFLFRRRAKRFRRDEHILI